jgi:hypothetical protein
MSQNGVSDTCAVSNRKPNETVQSLPNFVAVVVSRLFYNECHQYPDFGYSIHSALMILPSGSSLCRDFIWIPPHYKFPPSIDALIHLHIFMYTLLAIPFQRSWRNLSSVPRNYKSDECRFHNQTKTKFLKILKNADY